MYVFFPIFPNSTCVLAAAAAVIGVVFFPRYLNAGVALVSFHNANRISDIFSRMCSHYAAHEPQK